MGRLLKSDSKCLQHAHLLTTRWGSCRAATFSIYCQADGRDASVENEKESIGKLSPVFLASGGPRRFFMGSMVYDVWTIDCPVVLPFALYLNCAERTAC